MSEFIHDIEWHKEHKRLGFYDPIAELAEELEKIQLSKKDATSDCISRQEAIDIPYKVWNEIDENNIDKFRDMVQSKIEQLPSARKKGKWINVNDGKWNTIEVLKCSVCGEMDNRMNKTDNFCPNCGADMRGKP